MKYKVLYRERPTTDKKKLKKDQQQIRKKYRQIKNNITREREIQQVSSAVNCLKRELIRKYSRRLQLESSRP